MKRATKITVGVVALGVVGTAAGLLASSGGGDEDVSTVAVERGEIVDQALAVGQIEPDVEIVVKSQIAGVVAQRFADVGDFVEADTPLLEVRPNPTPLELVEARRRLQLREVEAGRAQREFERMRELRENEFVTLEELEDAQETHEQTRLNLELARERLALLEDGRVQSEAGDVEGVIRSPIDGFILEKSVEIGDPVVPLTTYQEGTVLMTMAAMDQLIFRGTVDEIDVGRLETGMRAEIQIGALPDARVAGRLTEISLKARSEENATVFPVEITLDAADETVLRAGFSANAEIIIERRTDVLTIPERLVTFEGDSARVEVLASDGTREWRTVETGLSDAVTVEVLSGLEEGERVIEPEPREIE